MNFRNEELRVIFARLLHDVIRWFWRPEDQGVANNLNSHNYPVMEPIISLFNVFTLAFLEFLQFSVEQWFAVRAAWHCNQDNKNLAGFL